MPAPRSNSLLLRLAQAWVWSSLSAAVVLTVLLFVNGATLTASGALALFATSMLLSAQGALPVVLLLAVARVVLRRTPLPIAYPTVIAFGMMVLGAAAATGAAILTSLILFSNVELGAIFTRVVLPTAIVAGIVAGTIIGRFDKEVKR